MGTRTVQTIYDAQATSDGDGVKINRIATRGQLEKLDPFLLLDEIASDDSADYIGGFPPHPHRGFETVTYMLEGAFSHKDHMGNEGFLKTGGVQWMTAGKGVIHSEMPQQNEGKLHGFQLWINLPAKDKMQPAKYQEYEPEDVAELTLENNGLARIIAGTLAGVTGPVNQVATSPSYFDIRLNENTQQIIQTTLGHNSMLFVYEGKLSIAGADVSQGQLAQLSDGEQVEIKTRSGAKFLFLSGKPIKEPIANYGPFVMNTPEEIQQAIQDYNNGTLV